MREQANALLKQMYRDQNASFKPGQWEAIDSVLRRNKTLVVQKTGWGKSLVYFLATKLLRRQGGGPTILISPLLALMRNQIDTAQRLGLVAQTINSDNADHWDQIEEGLRDGTIDLLLVSPERLANERFTRMLGEMESSIGMFVVDEAHCISDWGHDFRPDYRRIVRLIQRLAPNVPVLATTATANDRVVNDIKEQFGSELQIIRGPLTRESLCLQVIRLSKQEERLAWLAENLMNIVGTGIIYCSTIHDCQRVAQWLRSIGIEAYDYHARLHEDPEMNRALKEERERKLMNNEIKALVSTVALGMGFDKPDLAFVIHYQTPGSLVAYYQQIGRAGRRLDRSYAVLLVGEEDEEIQKYFIESAFPRESDLMNVLEVLEEEEGSLTIPKILSRLNMSEGILKKCLKTLEIEQAVVKASSGYQRTANPWHPDRERIERVTSNRWTEWRTVKTYILTDECYMQFIARELDDLTAEPCGTCANCLRRPLFPTATDHSLRLQAIEYLRGNSIPIVPRKMWPAGGVGQERGKIAEEQQTIEGRSLCLYADSGFGPLVRQGKYETKQFDEQLVQAAITLICDKWKPEPMPEWVTCVPSRREANLVPNFAKRVAQGLGIEFCPILEKVLDTQPQKEMENNAHKAANIVDAFFVSGECPPGPVLLIDDIVDSRWTFTVCGVQLVRAGSGSVYPFALADASRGGAGD